MGSIGDEAGSMDLGNEGYIYTLLTISVSFMILSLVFFYFTIDERPVDDTLTRMTTDELHYFIESIKKDCQRSVSISGQRASTYAVNHVIAENESLDGYVMRNCTRYNYFLNGSQAAITELMYCGTLNGDASGTAQFMRNHTLRDWIIKIRETSLNASFNLNIRFKNLTMSAFDSHNIIIITWWDISGRDKTGRSYYNGRDIPILSKIPLHSLEDPGFHMHVGMPTIYRYLLKCGEYKQVNASLLDRWIDEGCFISRENTRTAPSFFDRLDGSRTLNPKYVSQHIEHAMQAGFDVKGIGLESIIDITRMSRFNITIKDGVSHIDHMYWLDTPSRCSVRNMRHSWFRIDQEHLMDYRIRDASCQIIVSNTTGTDRFLPAAMTVPTETTISFSNPDDAPHTLQVNPDIWGGDLDVPASSSAAWKFMIPATYTVSCNEGGHGGRQTRIIVMD
ncbi:hypothetical protein ACFLRF_01875 [Candidatus Altiarchaeota archaeon]